MTINLTAILDACWGHGGYSIHSYPENPCYPPLTPQQTDLLLAALKLLNWDFSHLNAFLKEKLAIAKIENLPASQVDDLFSELHEAISDWLAFRIEGGQGASPGALSSAYWKARLAEYPQPVPPWVRKKRKGKWILDGYVPPEPKPAPAPEPEPETEPEPEPPDFWDWERDQFPDSKEWYVPRAA